MADLQKQHVPSGDSVQSLFPVAIPQVAAVTGTQNLQGQQLAKQVGSF